MCIKTYDCNINMKLNLACGMTVLNESKYFGNIPSFPGCNIQYIFISYPFVFCSLQVFLIILTAPQILKGGTEKQDRSTEVDRNNYNFRQNKVNVFICGVP